MNFDDFKGFSFEPQDEDSEVMLSELPLNVLEDSIRQQFNDPHVYAKHDFVQVFETRYTITKQEMDEENEEEILGLYNNFMIFMRDILKEKLSLGFPELEDMPEGEQIQLIHYTYRYFVTNLKRNFINYVYNYICKYKSKLVDILPRKKDVAYKTLKDIIEDQEDLFIIISLAMVVKYILEDDSIGVDEFIALTNDDDGNLENEFVADKYEDFNITGNFVPFYYKLLSEDLKVEIECTVRNMLLSKYRKKKVEDE